MSGKFGYIIGVSNQEKILKELEVQMLEVNGRRKVRILQRSDLIDLLETLNTKVGVKRVRIYGTFGGGFVPNCYKFRAPISYIEANQVGERVYSIVVGCTDAKRSYGNGSTFVAQPATAVHHRDVRPSEPKFTD